MSIPWAGWLGALAGTVIGVIIYVAALGLIEKQLRTLESPKTAQERAAFARRRSAMRRGILAIDIAICAVIGYWVGEALGHALGIAAHTGPQF
jgi:hypothetical protein